MTHVCVGRAALALAMLTTACAGTLPEEPHRSPEQRALSALEREATRRAQLQQFSGVVLVWNDDGVLLERAWGVADRETATAMTTGAKLRIGSLNKLFTSVATLQLVEAGRLELDTPIGRYLSDYPNADVAARVTLRHLLTHTGGTGDIFEPEYESRVRAARDHADLLAIFGERGLAFEPGTMVAYSNYGFILLGAIIERVTGRSYYDVVREQIYEPASMADTGSQPESEPVPGRVTGYTRPDNRELTFDPGAWRADDWRPTTDLLPYRGTAAGGGYTTARDLRAFVAALGSGQLLPRAVFEQAIRLQPNARAGLGFDVRERWYGHGGGAPGMNAQLRMYFESGIGLAILSNLDPPSADQLADFFERSMIEHGARP